MKWESQSPTINTAWIWVLLATLHYVQLSAGLSLVRNSLIFTKNLWIQEITEDETGTLLNALEEIPGVLSIESTPNKDTNDNKNFLMTLIFLVNTTAQK